MAYTTKYSRNHTQAKSFSQQGQPTLFSRSQMDRVKIKKEKPPVTPITITSYIHFGKYQGRLIGDIINDAAYITWYCRKTNRPLSPEVKTAIINHQYLSQ